MEIIKMTQNDNYTMVEYLSDTWSEEHTDIPWSELSEEDKLIFAYNLGADNERCCENHCGS
jgi:hypothetical protein